MDSRYQLQARHTRLYRWIRYKPLYAYKAFRDWIRHKDIRDSYYFSTIWSINMALADAAMQHVYTIDEILEEHGLDS